MDGAGQPRDRIGDRVDDIVAKRLGVTNAQRLGAGRFDAVTVADATPEHIVLAAAVDTDNRPHVVIVGHDRHHRRPDHIQDREVGSVVELLSFCASRFAEALENRGRISDSPGHHLTHQFVG